MDPEREEELPTGEVPQLAPRAQRLPDHVHAPQDRKVGQVHERSGGQHRLKYNGFSFMLRTLPQSLKQTNPGRLGGPHLFSFSDYDQKTKKTKGNK